MARKLSSAEIEKRVQEQMPGYKIVPIDSRSRPFAEASDGADPARERPDEARGDASLPELAEWKRRWNGESRWSKYQAIDAPGREIEPAPTRDLDAGRARGTPQPTGTHLVRMRPERGPSELDSDIDHGFSAKVMIADDEGNIIGAQG